MGIQDLELVKDINILFDNEIILYGAGYMGIKALEKLDEIGVDITCFCDGDIEKIQKPFIWEGRSYRVIDIEELKKLAKERRVIVIITSMQYAEDILENLKEHGEVGFEIFSYGGLCRCVDMNGQSQKLETVFRGYIWKRFRKLSQQNWMLQVKMENLSIMTANIINHGNPGIMVFVPAKVGSMTIKKSLEFFHVPCIHLHDFWGIIPYKTLIREKCSKIKIITLVREPIIRDISDYMEGLTDDSTYVAFREPDIIKGIQKKFESVVQLPWGSEFGWFDNLEELTGIDIFQYPFDRERGYSVIKKGKWEILVLKLEKLNENEKMVGEFIGIDNFKLQNDNIGDEKEYRYIYRQIKKELKIPASVVEKYYNHNERMDHFYTEKEKQGFLKYWCI